MENAMLVARYFGPIYLAVGLGMFVSGSYYKGMMDDMMKNKGMIYLGGILAFFVGMVILNLHSAWTKDWTVLVTILGWLALIKGALLLIVPEQFMAQFPAKKMEKMLGFAKFFALILGAAMSYWGYGI